MRVLRLVCTAMVSVYLCATCQPQLRAQTPQQQTPPQTPPATPQAQPPATPQAQPPTTPPAQAPKPAPGGFENVPTQQTQPKPPQLETPRQAPATPQQPGSGKVIAGIDFRGARRTPQDTLKAQIEAYVRTGDIYNEESLRRAYMVLWNTGKFDDISLESEDSPEGMVVRFILTERRVIRSIHYNCLLYTSKTPVEVFAVAHIERPGEN